MSQRRKQDVAAVPERLRDLFNPRVAKAAGLPAKPGAERIPFFVMCGSLDPRFPIAREFTQNLKDAGYIVDSEWPRTPHSPHDIEFRSEFEKYSRSAVEFFLHVIKEK